MITFQDGNGNWILNTDITVDFKTKNRQVTKPDDLAKAFRRAIGATKRWERRYIAECGGKDMRPNRYVRFWIHGDIVFYQKRGLKDRELN